MDLLLQLTSQVFNRAFSQGTGMTMTKAWFCGQGTIFVWIVTYVVDHRPPGRSCNEPVIATWQRQSQRKGFLLACLPSSLLAWSRSNYRFVQIFFIYPAVSLKEISACLSILLSVCGDKVCILFQKGSHCFESYLLP